MLGYEGLDFEVYQLLRTVIIGVYYAASAITFLSLVVYDVCRIIIQNRSASFAAYLTAGFSAGFFAAVEYLLESVR
jgi:hypothetical protein